MIRSIEEANIVEGTIILMRVDWNVPVENGKILDTSRIEATAETINFALKKGAKVIIMSHLGDGADSLEIVAKEAEKFFPNVQVKFIKDPWNSSSPNGKKCIESMQCGQITVLENLRFWMEKENNKDFAKKLADFGDIYVNEAFSVSHREHTSIVSLPRLLPAYAGFRFLEEYKKLSEVFNPDHPFLVILGGVKFDTKLPLVDKLLGIADEIFIGGTLAAKAIQTEIAHNPRVIFPIGDVAAQDVNAETLEMLEEKIKEAKFVLWNGPLGNYEKGFIAGTVALSRMLADAKVKVVIGGGDTLACVKDEIKNKISYHGFISTGGGAMLEFLASGTLPGIEALKN